MTKLRLTTWLLIGWSMLGVAGAYWGYRSVFSECPPPDDFGGCFEPPYRFAASVIFMFWAVPEAILILAWLVPPITALAERLSTRLRP